MLFERSLGLLVMVMVVTVARLAAATYPAYAKSRYSTRSLAWAPPPLSYYYPPRSTRPFYYTDSDYYYPQEPPSYYPIYQSVLPSYYLDQQRPPYYYSYDDVSEPVDELPEEVEVEEGGQRGEDAPYGQETWYQDPRLPDSNAEINARFLQNLILAQMYDANRRFPTREEEDSNRWVYGEPVKASKSKVISKEDEDVRELKSLARGPERADKTTTSASGAERTERSDKKRKNRKEENIFAAQTKSNDWSEFRSGQYKRSKSRTTTTATPDVTSAPVRGQKEVVLPRPASPVRDPDLHKFVNVRSETRRVHEPSVYDTIKKLLHMEDKLDESVPESRLKKRSYIPSEESLVAQLGGLKKMA